MEKEILISLANNFTDILPQNEESLLLLVWLYHKVENGYINEDFEQKDLDDTIEEVAEFMQKGSAIQKETLLKKLSTHFCHTQVIGNKYYMFDLLADRGLLVTLIIGIIPVVKRRTVAVVVLPKVR